MNGLTNEGEVELRSKKESQRSARADDPSEQQLTEKRKTMGSVMRISRGRMRDVFKTSAKGFLNLSWFVTKPSSPVSILSFCARFRKRTTE